MDVLTTLPDDDMCPKITEKMIGAFVKTSLDKPEVSKEPLAEDDKKTKGENKHEIKTSDKPEPRAPQPRPIDEDNSRTSQVDHELPALRPGPDGKIDWTPLAKLSGTRPPVNQYSLSRYSLGEWRKHNENVLNSDVITKSNIVDYNAKTSMMQAFGTIDKQQMENNKRLKQKAKDIFRWKVEVERASKMISEEVELLEIERQRLKGASKVLMLPESISRQCIEMRSYRAEPDLVADLAEVELVKEMNLVNEVRETLKRTLNQIEEQLKINKAAKHRIEYDWCDKSMAYNADTINLSLSTKSNTILFRPGATRYGEMSVYGLIAVHFSCLLVNLLSANEAPRTAA